MNNVYRLKNIVSRDEVVGADVVGGKVIYTRGRSVFCVEPKYILLGAEVSFLEGPKRFFFQKGPKGPRG